MNQIVIICGHGHFASGIQSALEMITGKKDTILAIDFEKDESDVILEEKIRKVVENFSDQAILFVCDLMGGSPFKVSTKIAFERPNWEVVTGINLGGLIDLSMKMNRLEPHDLAQNVVESSKKAVQLVEKQISNSISSEEGI